MELIFLNLNSSKIYESRSIDFVKNNTVELEDEGNLSWWIGNWTKITCRENCSAKANELTLVCVSDCEASC